MRALPPPPQARGGAAPEDGGGRQREGDRQDRGEEETYEISNVFFLGLQPAVDKDVKPENAKAVVSVELLIRNSLLFITFLF